MNTIIQAQNTKMAEKDFATAVETKADGLKRASIKEAEGSQQAQILEAEGKSKAIERVAVAQAVEIEKIATAKKFEVERYAEAEKFKIENIANADAEAIKLVNESAEKYFKGNAIELKKLEVTQASLEENAKIIVTKDGVNPTLVVNESKSKIIPTKSSEN